MFQSHEGLSKWYEVSCPELDFLEQQAAGFQGIAGARMMGGGFGGCTINIVPVNLLDQFSAFMTTAYEREYAKKPEIYITQLDNGAGIINT